MNIHHKIGSWSGGAKVLDKLSVPMRLTYLDNSYLIYHCTCKYIYLLRYL